MADVTTLVLVSLDRWRMGGPIYSVNVSNSWDDIYKDTGCNSVDNPTRTNTEVTRMIKDEES